MRPITYQAYVPDEIAHLKLLFPADLVQKMSHAESAVTAFERTVNATQNVGLARPFAVAEALGSGRLAGLSCSPRGVADTLANRNIRDEPARAIAGIARAIEQAINVDLASISPQELLGGIESALRGDIEPGQLRVSIAARSDPPMFGRCDPPETTSEGW